MPVDLQRALCPGLITGTHRAPIDTGVKITKICPSSCAGFQDELQTSQDLSDLFVCLFICLFVFDSVKQKMNCRGISPNVRAARIIFYAVQYVETCVLKLYSRHEGGGKVNCCRGCIPTLIEHTPDSLKIVANIYIFVIWILKQINHH